MEYKKLVLDRLLDRYEKSKSKIREEEFFLK
jgi:hypothetical protein